MSCWCMCFFLHSQHLPCSAQCVHIYHVALVCEQDPTEPPCRPGTGRRLSRTPTTPEEEAPGTHRPTRGRGATTGQAAASGRPATADPAATTSRTHKECGAGVWRSWLSWTAGILSGRVGRVVGGGYVRLRAHRCSGRDGDGGG